MLNIQKVEDIIHQSVYYLNGQESNYVRYEKWRHGDYMIYLQSGKESVAELRTHPDLQVPVYWLSFPSYGGKQNEEEKHLQIQVTSYVCTG